MAYCFKCNLTKSAVTKNTEQSELNASCLCRIFLLKRQNIFKKIDPFSWFGYEIILVILFPFIQVPLKCLLQTLLAQIEKKNNVAKVKTERNTREILYSLTKTGKKEIWRQSKQRCNVIPVNPALLKGM